MLHYYYFVMFIIPTKTTAWRASCALNCNIHNCFSDMTLVMLWSRSDILGWSRIHDNSHFNTSMMNCSCVRDNDYINYLNELLRQSQHEILNIVWSPDLIDLLTDSGIWHSSISNWWCYSIPWLDEANAEALKSGHTHIYQKHQ